MPFTYMQSSALRVSVVIDTYNYAAYLGEAIASVLQQAEVTPLEILVTDDGSIDETESLVRRYGPRVTYLRKPNGGQASNLNFGIARAHGDIVSFLDGDDFWMDTKLAEVVRVFEREPSALMVQHYQTNVDARGGALPTPFPPVPSRITLDQIRSGEAVFSGTSALSFRREALRAMMPIPERLVYCPDEYLYTFIHFHGVSFHIAKVLSARRLHGTNPSSSPFRSVEKLRIFLSVREFIDGRLADTLAQQGFSLTSGEGARRAYERTLLRVLEARSSGRIGDAIREALRQQQRPWCRALALFAAAIHPRFYEWLQRVRRAPRGDCG